MVFADLNFILVFFPVFLAFYFALPFRKYRNSILFIFSLVFYAWGEPLYVFLMIFSVFFNFIIALLMERNNDLRKRIFISGISINILLLIIFKYLDFFVSNFNALLGLNLPVFKLPLPIGISFYTFQLMSYIADVYAQKTRAQKNFVTLGAYLAGFPQLIAGPIVRYETIANELEFRRENITDFVWGIRRFMAGLAKKVIVANNMAFVVDNLLKELPANYGMAGAWIILIAYALQIYFDFSGYSDMAIGMGRMLGFHYLENFNYPYNARSVTEFWRKWHMSLTTFFRDYVYVPLGGNRVKTGRWIANILFVWALTGLWHGAKWNFVLWGLYYAVILVLEKTFLAEILKKLPSFVSRFYTIFAFLLGWALFRIESLASLKVFLATLIGRNGPGQIMTFVYSQALQAHFIIIFILAIIFSFPLAPKIKDFLDKTKWGNTVVDLWLIILFVISLALLLCGTYNPFIYFRF